MNSTTAPPRRRHPRPGSLRRRRLLVTGIAVVAAVIVAPAVHQSLATASAATAATSSPSSPDQDGAVPTDPIGQIVGSVIAPGDADGVIRDGDQPSVFDTDRVAVGNLDPALLGALQRAATDAAADGVELRVNSGWRSAALQDRMLQDAIAEYGSEAEAARWVATSSTSAHVSGDAVDLGPLPALDWLVRHGDDYGLCQIYGNESWHYELRPDAVHAGCPEMYADPTDDPRMQR